MQAHLLEQLSSSDAEMILGRYHLAIDYNQSLQPALSQSELEWMEKLRQDKE